MIKQGLNQGAPQVELRGADLRVAISVPVPSSTASEHPEVRALLTHVAQLLPDGPVNPERIYVTTSIAALAEGYDNEVFLKVLREIGSATNCERLAQKLEALAEFGPFNEAGFRSVELDIGAALEALVVLAERGTERSGELAASTAVQLASTRPEIVAALAATTSEVISRRRAPIDQGLMTLALGLALASNEAKQQLESDELWRESGLKDLTAVFHRNDLGKLLVYSSFPAINVILQDCCSSRPSYGTRLLLTQRTQIKNKICRRVRDNLVKYSQHSPKHLRQVLSIALDCADQSGEKQVQLLAQQILSSALEYWPKQRGAVLNFLTRQVSDRGDTRAAALLSSVSQPEELKTIVSKILAGCSPRKRIFERNLAALLILCRDDSSEIVLTLANSPAIMSKLPVETRTEILRAIDRDARAHTGVADQFIGAGILNLTLGELNASNGVFAVRAASSLAGGALSNSQQQLVANALVQAIPTMSAQAFTQLRDFAPTLVSAIIAPAVAEQFSQVLNSPGLHPDSVTRCAAFIAACCRGRHSVAACFERAGIESALRPWIGWVDLSRQITIELAIARIIEKPMPAESVFSPWLQRVIRQVESSSGFDKPQSEWVCDQVGVLQRRSATWSKCISEALCAEIKSAIPATSSYYLLTAIASSLAGSSFSAAKALYSAGVHQHLSRDDQAELIDLIALGNGSSADYMQAAIMRGVGALRQNGDLRHFSNIGFDRAANRELVRQMIVNLGAENLAHSECLNILKGIKLLLVEEELASEPFTQAVLASNLEDELNRRIDFSYELAILEDADEMKVLDQLTLEILEILHTRRRG